MINKLLDESYWNEINLHLYKYFKGGRHFLLTNKEGMVDINNFVKDLVRNHHSSDTLNPRLKTLSLSDISPFFDDLHPIKESLIEECLFERIIVLTIHGEEVRSSVKKTKEVLKKINDLEILFKLARFIYQSYGRFGRPFVGNEVLHYLPIINRKLEEIVKES